MTDQATRVVPAGWYQDPASESHVRWWNGLTWTEHVENKPELPVQPAASTPALAITDERVAAARAMEREFGISTAENAIMTSAATAGIAGVDGRTGHAAQGSKAGALVAADRRADDADADAAFGRAAAPRSRRSTSTSTMGAILLSLVPAFAVTVTLVSAYIFLYIKPTPLVGLVGVVFMLLTFLWAVSDRRALEARGIDGPSPGWSLALPFLGALVYLIARRVRVKGTSHLVIFAVLSIVAIGGPFAAAAAGGASAPLKALEVQQTVYAGLVDTDRLSAVTCPAFVENTTPGSVFTCEGTLPDGSATTVWVSIDSPEGAFSWSLSAR